MTWADVRWAVTRGLALGFLATFAVLMWSGCGPMPPVPPGPDPVADAAVLDVPPDPFAGVVVDCAEASPVRDQVRTCLQVTNTASCLADLLPTHTPASVACTVRDLDVELHERAARETATDSELLEARAASRWIWEHRIGYRDGRTP